jgi:hypothetical protein
VPLLDTLVGRRRRLAGRSPCYDEAMLSILSRAGRAVTTLMALGCTGCFLVLDLPEVDDGTGGTGGTGMVSGGSSASGGAGTGGTDPGGSGANGGAAASPGSGGGVRSTGGSASGGTSSGGSTAGGHGGSTAGGTSSGGTTAGSGGDGSGDCAAPCDCDGDGQEAIACGGHDCDDDDANVFKGQTEYFAVPAKNGGFDYDCSGGPDREHTTTVACSGLLGVDCDNKLPGFLFSLPLCGETGQWGGCQVVAGPPPLSLAQCDPYPTGTATMRCK